MDGVCNFHMNIEIRLSFRPVRTRADWALEGQTRNSFVFGGVVLVQLLFGRPAAATISFPTLPGQILTISLVGNKCNRLVVLFFLPLNGKV
jgi:hypothetical protein